MTDRAHLGAAPAPAGEGPAGDGPCTRRKRHSDGPSQCPAHGDVAPGASDRASLPPDEDGQPGAQARDRAAALAKAATLIEALPWLDRFHGQTIVIKYGGHAMTDESLRRGFAQDLVFLRYAGLRPVVVHGGGPQINAHLDRLGIESTFTSGLRVTTPEIMRVVRMVLTGQVNRDVVGLVNQYGPWAVGMSGEDANLFTARRAQPLVDGETVDIGLVGEITEVDAGAVHSLLADRRIPVISSVAQGSRWRDLQRQRRHRGRRSCRRCWRGQAGGAHRRRGPVRGLAGVRRGDQPAHGGRTRGPAARAHHGHGAEDGGLPARGPRRRPPRARPRRAAPARDCCWKSSPIGGSARW